MQPTHIRGFNDSLKSLLIILVLSHLTSCSNQNQSTRDIKRHLIEIEKKISLDKSGKENFDSFFEFFKQDTIFEFERTSPPYVTKIESVTINAAGDQAYFIDSSFNKKDWMSASSMSNEHPKIEINNDSAVIIFYETISREAAWNYYFIRSKGKWYLKTLRVK